jgi:DNA-directed RNA polymerase subunit RPC12/RpoP
MPGSGTRTTGTPAKKCPNCSSTELMVGRREGMERLMVLLTGKRRYRCTRCERSFRAYGSRANGGSAHGSA